MFFVFEGLMSISKLDTFRLDLVILFALSELGRFSDSIPIFPSGPIRIRPAFRLDLDFSFWTCPNKDLLSDLHPRFFSSLDPVSNKTCFQTPSSPFPSGPVRIRPAFRTPSPSCLSSLPCPNKTLFQTPSLFSSLPLSECFSLPFVNLAQLCSSVVNFFQPINQDFIKNILYQKTDGMKSIGFVFGALFFCWSRSIWLQTF